MGAEESNDYRGFNSEQLASMLGKVKRIFTLFTQMPYSPGFLCLSAFKFVDNLNIGYLNGHFLFQLIH